MNQGAILSATTALLLICAVSVPAQSLADLAKKEEERRKTVKGAGKVYTNDSLPGEAQPPAPAPPQAQPSSPAPASPSSPQAAPGTPAPAPDPSGAGAPRTEAEWKKRITDARQAMSRAQMFAEALQSRINVLSADYVNRDDPAQRDSVAGDRQKALAELDRVKQEIQGLQKTIAGIQDEARKAGVPAGWVR